MGLGVWVDKLVSVWAPQKALLRVNARRQLDTHFKSYDAGKLNRLNNFRPNSESGDSPNLSEVQLARSRAWSLWRNNKYATKIVRSLTSKVLGRGLMPRSQAVTVTGREDKRLRKQIDALFTQWAKTARFRMQPGQGACSWPQLQKMALREWILSGEVFTKKVTVLPLKKGKVPLALQMIEAERVDEGSTFLTTRVNTDSVIFRGVEIDKDGIKVAYHIRNQHPASPVFRGKEDTQRVPAREIVHLYNEDRPTQFRGVTWFMPISPQIRDITDYQASELASAAVSSCFAAVIKVNPGAGALTLNAPNNKDNLDGNDNQLTRLEPGIVARLNPGEDIEGVNPTRPGSEAEPFIKHLLAGAAVGAPGTKASTVTGDYSQSSFSSERAADNDTHPEIEDIQDEFICSWCEPIYQAFLEHAQLASLLTFDDIERAKPATWSTPVVKSINPLVDVRAAAMRVAAGQSSIQQETAALGNEYKAVLEETAEAFRMANETELPDEFGRALIGLGAKEEGRGGSVNGPNSQPKSQNNGNGNGKRLAGMFNDG